MPDKHHHGSHGSHSHGSPHSHDSHGHPHQDSDVHEHHHNHPRDLFTADSQLSEQLTPYPQPRFYDPVSSRTLNSQKRRENSKRLQHQQEHHHHHSHGDSHRSQRLLHGGHDNSGKDKYSISSLVMQISVKYKIQPILNVHFFILMIFKLPKY